jgi:hypothetical protein
MAFAEALSDDGSLTGRGSPWLRGAITGIMTALGGLGHAVPYLVPDSWPRAFWIATSIAGAVVFVELWAIAFIRAANGRQFLQSQCSSYLGIIATAWMPTPVLLITAAMTALARGWLSSNPQSSADRMMLSVVAHRAGDPHRPPLNAPQMCRLKRQSCGKRQFSRMP